MYVFDGKIATAMKTFPNLKKIALSAGFCPHTKAYRKAFTPSFVPLIDMMWKNSHLA